MASRSVSSLRTIAVSRIASSNRPIISSNTLFDKFTTTRNAGSIDGTPAEPTGGNRTVVDVNNKISINNNSLVFSTGGVSLSGLQYPSLSRTSGMITIYQVVPGDTSGNTTVGWTNITRNGIEVIRINGGGAAVIGIVANATGSIQLGTIVASGAYYLAVILRTTGSYYFVKGGAYSYWTLLWEYHLGTTSSMFPSVTMGNTSAISRTNFVKIPTILWLPSPTVSDSFARENGSLGTTNGRGHAETTGIGSGGSGFTWTNTLGTWAISNNTATATSISGSAFATVNSGKSDVMVDVKVTRGGGVAGIVLRYANSTNYVIAYYDGTNAADKEKG